MEFVLVIECNEEKESIRTNLATIETFIRSLGVDQISTQRESNIDDYETFLGLPFQLEDQHLIVGSTTEALTFFERHVVVDTDSTNKLSESRAFRLANAQLQTNVERPFCRFFLHPDSIRPIYNTVFGQDLNVEVWRGKSLDCVGAISGALYRGTDIEDQLGARWVLDSFVVIRRPHSGVFTCLEDVCELDFTTPISNQPLSWIAQIGLEWRSFLSHSGTLDPVEELILWFQEESAVDFDLKRELLSHVSQLAMFEVFTRYGADVESDQDFSSKPSRTAYAARAEMSEDIVSRFGEFVVGICSKSRWEYKDYHANAKVVWRPTTESIREVISSFRSNQVEEMLMLTTQNLWHHLVSGDWMLFAALEPIARDVLGETNGHEFDQMARLRRDIEDLRLHLGISGTTFAYHAVWSRAVVYKQGKNRLWREHMGHTDPADVIIAEELTQRVGRLLTFSTYENSGIRLTSTLGAETFDPKFDDNISDPRRYGADDD